MTDTLQTNWENIRTLQNQRASAELQLANLQEELHNSELWKKIEEKQREVRELNDRETAMKDSILAWMIANWLKTVEFTNQRFTAKQNPWSVNIIDEEIIPQNFKKLQTKVVVDKTAIKKAIQAWEEVVWAEVTYWYSLVITPR